MSDAAQYEAVRVHVAGSDVDMGGTGRARRRRRSVCQTITLNTNEAAQNLLPASEWRRIAFIVPLDQAIVYGPNRSDVANGVGTIVPQNTAWPIEDDNALFVAPSPAVTGTTTARVSIAATYEDGEWLPSR